MIDDLCIDFMVGIPDNPAELAEVVIYPNPASDQVNIVSPIEISEVMVYNYLGQRVHSQVVGGNEFRMNTETFGTGVYYFQIVTAEGMSTHKVIVN
jgi:hypothetical protein